MPCYSSCPTPFVRIRTYVAVGTRHGVVPVKRNTSERDHTKPSFRLWNLPCGTR